MEDLLRIMVMEKRMVVDRVVSLLNGAGELFLESELFYVTRFTRHVDRCCDNDGLMKEADVWGLDSVRRDVDRGCEGIDGGQWQGGKYR
jgi:hypothetical protein